MNNRSKLMWKNNDNIRDKGVNKGNDLFSLIKI